MRSSIPRLIVAVAALMVAGACAQEAPTAPSTAAPQATPAAPADPTPTAAPSPSPTPTPTPSPAPPSPSPSPTPAPAVAPTITTQPASQTQETGHTAQLSVQASGTEPLSYQWYVGSSGSTSAPAAGATSAVFQTPVLTTTTSYWVRVSNAGGSVDSNTATITITAPAPPPPPPPPAGVAPAITTQPQSASVSSGQSATLIVAASGTSPLSYQWYVGASGSTALPVGGATSPSFTTPALTGTTSYWVRVSNAYGTADSTTATITVTVPVSTNSGFEDQVLILVNQQRALGATCGGTAYPATGPLSMNASLRTAARNHSIDMAANNYFSHTSLDGRTFDQRIFNAGYTGSFPLGENIAAGQPTPSSVVSAWMASPGHCTNIMTAGFHAVGIGYAFSTSSTYGHYWTMDFGGS